jgi:hypothetical protein
MGDHKLVSLYNMFLIAYLSTLLLQVEYEDYLRKCNILFQWKELREYVSKMTHILIKDWTWESNGTH